jgi:hypothetical protein
MMAISLHFAIGFFVVCAMIFTVLVIRLSLPDPEVICITCGTYVYQDADGTWRHDNKAFNIHPVTPRKVYK